MFRQKKGQSVLEFALLLGIVLVAIMIMQVFIKRGYQGRLKESAEGIGEQYSAGGTAIKQERTMEGNQTIMEETTTNKTTKFKELGFNVSDDEDAKIRGTVAHGAYSYTRRSGVNQTVNTTARTEALTQEKFKWGEYQNTTYDDFNVSD